MESNRAELGTRGEKRAFYKYVLKITTPIALQNLMDTAVSSADVVMLSFVGQNAMAASSLAGQVAFVLNMLLYGITSGSAVICSQYWGRGDKRTVERAMGLALRVAFIIGLVCTLGAMIVPELIMKLFTNDAALIADGVTYLKWVGISYVTGAFGTVYLGVQRCVERVRMSAAIHTGAVLLNILLNACLIFGWGFFPKMGIAGVALATTITRCVEVVICLIDSQVGPILRLRVKDLYRKCGELWKDFLRFSIPAAANDVVWGLAFSAYSVILGHLSADVVAANSVASVVRNWGTVVCFGCSSSAAIILGKTMGHNQLKEAKVYAKRFIFLSFATAVVGGILLLLTRPLILKYLYLYVEVTDTVYREVSTMLYINCYYIIGVSVNTMIVCGVFRAGGDTKFGFIGDTVAMWGYAVPIGLLSAFVLKLPEMWVYFILCLDEFVKMPAFFIHYFHGKWLKNITRDNI